MIGAGGLGFGLALVLAVCGLAALILGAVGAARMRAGLDRLHALTLAIGVGAPLCLLAAAAASAEIAIGARLVVAALLAGLIGPRLAHILAQTAYADLGLDGDADAIQDRHP